MAAPLDDGHHLAWRLRREQEQTRILLDELDRALPEGRDLARKTTTARDPVDALALRGVPVVCHDGIGGEIRGTRPDRVDFDRR